MINVENFLNERFPSLPERKLIYSGLCKILKRLFHENEFLLFEKRYPHLQGLDFVEQALQHFEFSYSTFHDEFERIPTHGRVVIIANHPIGSLDGLALLNMIGKIRKDVKVVANDVLGAIQPLKSLLLSVDNMNGNTAKQNLRDIYAHLNHEGAVIIFPAGSVSRLAITGIKDTPWNTGFLKIANRTQSPILPMYVNGRNSGWFYSVSFFAKPLSTLFLVDEMFKQEKKNINIRIGHPIPFRNYHQIGESALDVAKLFRQHVYKLENKQSEIFGNTIAIAQPENRIELMNEIRQCEQLGTTSDGKIIYLYQFKPESCIMKEIGRLREFSFRAVGEGSGKKRDIDHYDINYEHIVLWDDEELQIVGSYRVAKAAKLIQEHGIQSLYSSRLFDYKEAMNPVFEQGLELGRSFVQPHYWGKRSLDYLWFGIGAYIQKNPEIRYLFGAVSISNDYTSSAKSSLVHVYQKHFLSKIAYAEARIKFNSMDKSEIPAALMQDKSYKKDFAILKAFLANQQLAVPTLYKQYFNVCEEGGVSIVDFNIDPEFSHCVDGLIIADMYKLKKSKRERYMPEKDGVEIKESTPLSYSLGDSLQEAFTSQSSL